MIVSLRRAAVLSAVAVLAPPLAAQRNVPSTYAITNAKLVPVSAPVIPKGTIVIRDGLIVALGANVTPPADARIIDGTGLTVYLGLFDSFGTIGLPAARPAGGGGGGGAAAAIAALTAPATGRSGNGSSFDQPRGVEPELSAAEQVKLDEEALDGPRSAGITTALTSPSAGVFQGQSALINLGGANSSAMIVRPNVAQQIGFSTGGRGGGGGGGYPGSLMGVFAVLRQELLDAQRYRDIKAAYDKNPKGLQRPEFDPSLESLLPALAKQQPVVMIANSQREIERALDLAKEFGLRAIIAGGSEAYLVADRLKAENVPVLLSINFPRRTVAPAPDAEPEPTRVLRERVEWPKGPGRLATAGVKFAFQSGGLTNWADFTTNVQRAVEGGLSADNAIKALTSQPAELFGVGDRMGSLEAGKIANLTVTRGDLTDKGVRISQLFVDGRPIALHPPAAANGGGGFPGRGGGGGGGGNAAQRIEHQPGDARMSPLMPKNRIAFAVAAFGALVAPQAHAQTRAAAAPILIKNGTVMTVTRGTLTNTDVLLSGGKIAQIGKNLSAPANATVIDATGEFIMPGIIDPHSHMAADAINEGSLSVTSMARIRDVLDPTTIHIYYALAGGVTTLNVLHGSANTIGGQNAVIKLKWGRSASEMLFPDAMPGIKFALGENVTRKNSGGINIPGVPTPPRRYPGTRMGQEEVLRDAFMRARDYKASWDDYRAKSAKDKTLLAPRRDLELEPLMEVLEGKRFVHAHSYRADEMLMLLNLADEFGFKVKTLQHALEGYKIADEIAKHGAGLSTFADEWSYKIEAYDAIPYNVAINMRHGVLTTINSDDDGRARRLNIDAAKMIRYGGLTEDEALSVITINGAKQLGIDKRVGSIEVGKDADIAIFNANPLSVYSSVEQTIIDGEVFFDKKKDLAMRATLASERAELEKAEANQAPARGGRGAGAPGAPTNTPPENH